MNSDEELVFLIRQGNKDAKRLLQNRLYSKQDRNIRKMLNENRYCGLEREDLFAVADKALDICIDSFDPRKTVFDAFYHLVLSRELVNEMQRYSSPSQVMLNVSMSLDAPIDDENSASLYDLVGKEEPMISSYDNLFFSKENQLSEIEKQVLYLRSLDYNFREIAKKLNKNYRQISRIFHDLVRKKGADR